MGFNCLQTTESVRGESLLFTTRAQGVSDTHLINHGRMKGWVNLGAITCWQPLPPVVTGIGDPNKYRARHHRKFETWLEFEVSQHKSTTLVVR